MKKIIYLALLFPLFSSPYLWANTSLDIGEGAIPCKTYYKKSLDKKNNFIIWVQGCFSAFNALDPNTKSINGDKDFHFVLDRLDTYCKANPDQYFGEAVRVLIEELYPNRIPNYPQPKDPTQALERIKIE